ncbi:MAG: hypothetical protein GC201_14700 [Alphaproteobacteria bacterium]|nr:hypothetical protein [Alphaproteobacteria bacterium]
MPQVEVDVANVRTVQGELTPTAGPPRPVHEPPRPGSSRHVLIVASVLSVIWLALCGLYAFYMQTSAALATVSVEQAVLYAMATILPLLAVWLVSINLLQARALRYTSELINDSLVSMTYPSDEAQQRVAWAVRNLKAQAAQLEHATELARERSEAMELMLRRQTDTLFEASDTLERGTGQARTVLDAQATTLGEALETLERRAAAIERAVGASVEKLSRTSAQSVEATRAAQALLANRSDDMLTAAERAAKRTEAISESYSRIVGQMDAATASAAKQIDEINRGYAAQAKAMMGAGDLLAAKMRDITEVTRREVIAMEEAGERSRYRAEKMEETVAAHGKRLNAIAEEAQRWIKQTSDHFSLQTEFMKGLSEEALQGLNNGIGDAVSRVDDAGKRFIALTASMQARAGEASAQMGEAGERMRQQADTTTAAWQGAATAAAEQAAQSATAFRERTGELERMAAAAADSIAQASHVLRLTMGEDAEAVLKEAQTALAGIETLRASLQQASGEVGAASLAASEAIDATGQRLGGQVARLEGAADAATSRARALGETVAQETGRIVDVAGRAEVRVTDLGSKVGAAAERLGALGTSLERQSHTLEETLAARSANLSGVLRQTLDEAGRVEQVLSAAAEGLTHSAGTFGGRARASALELLNQMQGLRDTAAESVRQLEAAAAAVLGQGEAVSHSTDGAAQRIEKLRLALEAHDVEARRVSNRAFERVLSVGEILETVSQKLTTVADDAVGALGRSAEDLSSRADAARDTAEAAATSVTATGKLLESNSLRLAAYSREAEQFRARADGLVAAARELAQAATQAGGRAALTEEAFQARAQRLIELAESLGKRLAALEALERQATGSAFSRTANNILESLGSLAIDLDRLLEAEIPQKIWQQYKGGDTQAFARHIARQASGEWEDKIAQKFRGQPDFRDYVTRYVTQFEGLLRQTMENERTDALAASLLSSDMGKLYVLLAKSINRLH